ncbi:MAG: 4Fe-4S binding protein [Nitrososphaeria archaeon]
MNSEKKRKMRGNVEGNARALATGFKYLVEPNRMTLDYPVESMKLASNYRGFFTVDDKKCIGCSMCEMVCPPEAITMVPRVVSPTGETLPVQEETKQDAGAKPAKKTKRPVVNWGRCIYCYFCFDICPVDAFVRSNIHDLAYYNDADYRPSYEEYLKLPEDPVKKSKKVVPKPDLKRGIKYEPAP